MNNADDPKLIFQYEFDEYEQYEAKARGVLSYAQVLLKNGLLYPVTFYNTVRLGQDLEEKIK
ncbi:MAG: hypothetical protein PUP91_36165 [Rhizonema sp. PD37]|nr:hypothetical protein [Rhizonema sp. PD37]